MNRPTEPMLPPVWAAEVMPGLEVLKVDCHGVRRPQPLRMTTPFRHTAEWGSHALARDVATGKPVVVRASEIAPAGVHTGGRPAPFRLYRLRDVDATGLSGFAPDELIDLAGTYGRDEVATPHANFGERIKPFDPVRPGEVLPPRSLLVVFKVETDLMYDSDTDVSVAVRRTGDEPAPFDPTRLFGHGGFGNGMYVDWWAVVAGPANELRYVPNFKVDECGTTASVKAVAERLRAIALNLRHGIERTRLDPSRLGRVREAADRAHGVQPGTYFGEESHARIRLKQCGRNLELLARCCGDRAQAVTTLGHALATAGMGLVAHPEAFRAVTGADEWSEPSDVAECSTVVAQYLEATARELSPARADRLAEATTSRSALG